MLCAEKILIDPFSKGWVCFVALEMDERAARYSLGLKRGYSGGTGFLNDGTQGLYSWHVAGSSWSSDNFVARCRGFSRTLLAAYAGFSRILLSVRDRNFDRAQRLGALGGRCLIVRDPTRIPA